MEKSGFELKSCIWCGGQAWWHVEDGDRSCCTQPFCETRERDHLENQAVLIEADGENNE